MHTLEEIHIDDIIGFRKTFAKKAIGSRTHISHNSEVINWEFRSFKNCHEAETPYDRGRKWKHKCCVCYYKHLIKEIVQKSAEKHIKSTWKCLNACWKIPFAKYLNLCKIIRGVFYWRNFDVEGTDSSKQSHSDLTENLAEWLKWAKLTLGDTDLILSLLGGFISVIFVSTNSWHYFEGLFD
jgi:hypothetical protein